ncbi:MAG: hypothetical protein IJB21_03135 [Bacilli bacterium]|nr:hypothetical protein [Bacilli bacterium]
MKKRKLKYGDKYNKVERPYYIIKDNDNSRIRILKINNFSSIEEIVHDKMLTKALVVDNFFDTNYMKKIKREAVKYPVAKELEI